MPDPTVPIPTVPRYQPQKPVTWQETPAGRVATYRLMRIEVREQFTGGDVLYHCWLDGTPVKTEFDREDAEDWLCERVDWLWKVK